MQYDYKDYAFQLYRIPDEEKFLPMLLFVLIHGNVTIYQWKHGVPPQDQNTAETTPVQPAQAERDEDVLEIDWGGNTNDAAVPPSDSTPTTGQSDGIGFGIDFGETEIDFSIDETVDLSCITVEESGETEENLETVGSDTSHPVG